MVLMPHILQEHIDAFITDLRIILKNTQ
jgi:hypothetical protein